MLNKFKNVIDLFSLVLPFWILIDLDMLLDFDFILIKMRGKATQSLGWHLLTY